MRFSAIITGIPCTSIQRRRFPAFSYPGYALRIGSSGDAVRQIQEQLNAISNNYPLIPKIAVDGIFGPATENAVKVFQSVFGLTQDGIVGRRTWYRIQDIYVAVTRIAELYP